MLGDISYDIATLQSEGKEVFTFTKGGTSISLPMRADIMVHIQNLVPTTLFQVGSKIHSQS